MGDEALEIEKERSRREEACIFEGRAGGRREGGRGGWRLRRGGGQQHCSFAQGSAVTAEQGVE